MLMIFVPMVLMIRQPPVKVPSEIAVAAAITTQSGTLEVSGAELAAGDQRKRDQAHGLLCVVGAVRSASSPPDTTCPELEAAADAAGSHARTIR